MQKICQILGLFQIQFTAVDELFKVSKIQPSITNIMTLLQLQERTEKFYFLYDVSRPNFVVKLGPNFAVSEIFHTFLMQTCSLA